MSFAEWQPIYAEAGIPTFPVTFEGKDKRPAVKNYLKGGLPASRHWADRFGAAEAFGFGVKRARLTVVDVDTPDEGVLAEALATYGPTPLVVRTQSGGFHAYYRNNGEKRQIRPNPEKPIDVLGDGYLMAAPSKGHKGRYEIVQGGLDDLGSLPKIVDYRDPDTNLNLHPFSRPLPAETPSTAIGADLVSMAPGGRNDGLWRFLMGQASSCDDFDALLDVAISANDLLPVPLGAGEIVKIARSAWGYEQRGANFFGKGKQTPTSHAAIDDLAGESPDALALLNVIRRHHSDRPTFMVANAMAGTTLRTWSLKRLQDARRVLLDRGYIRLVMRGSKLYGASLYGWGTAR